MSRIKTATPTPLLDATTSTAEPVAQLVEVFRDDLGDVAFPDVSLTHLEEAVEVVHQRRLAVERTRAQVVAAEAELEESGRQLDALAAKALAYARVYAVGNPDLTEKLSKIGVSQAPIRRRRKSGKGDARPEGTEPIVESVPVLREESRGSHLSMVG